MLNGWDEVERWLDLGEEPKGWEEGKEGTGGLLRGRGGLEWYVLFTMSRLDLKFQ